MHVLIFSNNLNKITFTWIWFASLIFNFFNNPNSFCLFLAIYCSLARFSLTFWILLSGCGCSSVLTSYIWLLISEVRSITRSNYTVNWALSWSYWFCRGSKGLKGCSLSIWMGKFWQVEASPFSDISISSKGFRLFSFQSSSSFLKELSRIWAW